jgi:nucleoside-diphosphate-sugar epimerase
MHLQLKGGKMNHATKDSAGKVLVVGGAGYVGCVLAAELLDRGYAVKVFDRMYYGAQGLTRLSDQLELEVGDIRTMSPETLEGVDAVINLAGLSNDPTADYNPKANYEMNTTAAVHLAQLCRGAGVQRYIFASSCSIYDFGQGVEERDVLADETSSVDPQAAYSRSKFEAERLLLEMTDKSFSPVILRKGTVFGFSPRMRYDLVVNTFVKDALSKGCLTLHCGGEMWRPMVEVRDAARAYVACVEAPLTAVHGQIFNVVGQNYRISELGLHVRSMLCELGHKVDIKADYGPQKVRNYRVCGKKLENLLDYRPTVTVDESVRHIVENIQQHGYTDFENSRYYNIRWMKTLEEADACIKITGSVFEAPKTSLRRERYAA